jgi:beta-galactosidase/beta-glucuronidase
MLWSPETPFLYTAVRSSHNMPSIEQLELCDEMGFMFMAESFDECICFL